MKFLSSADWHIKLWSDKETSEDNLPLRLHEIFGAITQMCDYGMANDIHLVVMAGDVNDLKNIVHVKPFARLKKLLEMYSDLTFVFLHGNHDSTARIDEDSSVELLTNGRNIFSVVANPLVEDDITYLPYSKNMTEQLAELEPNKVLISHFGLNEAQLSNGHSLRSSITIHDLQKFGIVILGHYHKPQSVGNTHYCGSPIQLRRDEAGEEKRFLIVDTETLTIESIPFVGYRKYVELVIDDPAQIESVLEECQQLKAEGNFVHLRKTIEDRIEAPADVNIIDDYEEQHQTRGITTAMTLQDQMKKWLEIERIPEENWDEYIKVGLEAIT